jgi:hypothetical protein
MKPDDIPQDVWNKVRVLVPSYIDTSSCGLMRINMTREAVSRAIMAAKAEERSVFTDEGRDNDALNPAVGVLGTQQDQPHKSTQSALWEAIKDYAERAAIRKRGE